MNGYYIIVQKLYNFLYGLLKKHCKWVELHEF